MQPMNIRFGSITPFKLTDSHDRTLGKTDNPKAWDLALQKLGKGQAVEYSINGIAGPIRMDYFLADDDQGNHLTQYEQAKFPESPVIDFINQFFNSSISLNSGTVERLLADWQLKNEVSSPRSFQVKGDDKAMTVEEKTA
jgi:hypothetical protein